MRKGFVYGMLLAVIVALALPFGLTARAQEPADIVDLAVADGRFTTLVAAVTAAGLVDTLKSEGPFTVFAPTDDAFAKLPAGTVEALLADIPALTNILTYHVVAGKVMAADVVGLSSAPTVQGAEISITVDGGRVFLNGTVEVIITDIDASNGVIHVIDSVLLPPAEQTPAMEPVEDMAAMTFDPAMAYFRIAHLAADAPAVDLFINGALSDIQGLAFPQITGWVGVPAGTYSAAVAPAGTNHDSSVIGPVRYELQAGTFYTIAAIGRLDAGTLTAQVIREPFNPLIEGNARVAVFHAIPDAPAVDVRLADGTVLVPGLSYATARAFNSGFASLDVPAGTYDLQVVPAGASEPVVIDLSDTTLEAGKSYFVAAVGTLASPGVALAVTELPTTPVTVNLPSIVEIAASNSDFSTLVAAVQAAGLVEALSGEGPFTVFAPTNEAFAAALAALNLTAEQLLADTETLTAILLYHVVPGAVTAEQVVRLSSATTLNGADIQIAVEGGNVVLNGGQATVIATDVMASNGVIHVIDGVILPPAQ